MQKISNFLWFDKEARDATKFYLSIFKNSKLKSDVKLDETPSGQVDILNIEIEGTDFSLMSAGPYFKLNPSISFTIISKSINESDALWEKLSIGGTVLMPYKKYPWSEKYGWLNDKFGVSWQIMTEEKHTGQKIIPTLLFTQKVCGKTKEAIEFYSKIFKNSKTNMLVNYEKGELPQKESVNWLKYSSFTLENQNFVAMDGGLMHEFTFNEATSFVIDCDGQKETDYFWESLLQGGEKSQCGWLKDKFGVSWQVVPKQLNELMSKDKSGKVMQAMLAMQKIVIKDLEKAYDDNN